jgi:hypothetical protein
MRVIYSACVANPWIKEAEKLKEEFGYEPVYWIGLWDDNSKALVSNSFPACIYQDYFDAWKGIFPSQVTEYLHESYIDIDFLKEYSSFELQAIKMMDRMDPDQYSFNFTERQRHYRNLLRRWAACLINLKIDCVIFGVVPHQVFDYVMYLLCRLYKIKFVCLHNSQFPGRVFPINDLSSIGDQILSEYQNFMTSGKDTASLEAQLPVDILNYYEKIQIGYDVAQPEYKLQGRIDHKKSDGFFSLMVKFIKEANNNRTKFLGTGGILWNGFPLFDKQKNKTIEKSNYNIIQYSLLRLKTNWYKVRLQKYYNSLTVQPDYTAKYVFFSLHYQPEMTTSPGGDIFVDQRLCIEVLHKQLPSDYLIYVKEHPAQFHSHLRGHTSRAKYLYDDLISYPKVRLVPLETDQFKLIKNAKAISTIVGTVGWEAMAMGKPVIAFGLIWYEKYEGVLKITNEQTASKIMEFINNFKFEKNKLMAYLNAFCKTSDFMYVYIETIGKVDITENECIERLAKLIKDSIDHD